MDAMRAKAESRRDPKTTADASPTLRSFNMVHLARKVVVDASGAERRRHPRIPTVALCKIRDKRNLLYAAGETINLSDSGVLLHLRASRPFANGDLIEVVIASDENPIVSREQVRQGIIRRVSPDRSGHLSVAVEFEEGADPDPTFAMALAA